jgi:hypothetical protein
MISTTASKVPIAIRSGNKLGDSFEKRVRDQLSRRIGPAMFVERATVRFEDVNGPKGGVDMVCRIKLVVSGRPSIVVVKQATSEPLAFADAVQAVGVAVARANKKRGSRSRERTADVAGESLPESD